MKPFDLAELGLEHRDVDLHWNRPREILDDDEPSLALPTWSAVAAGTERRRSSPITRDRSPRPPGSLPTGPAFGFLLAPGGGI
jgi:hypothetical protein